MNQTRSNSGKLTFMAVMLAITIVFVMVTAIPNFSISMAVATAPGRTALTRILYLPAERAAVRVVIRLAAFEPL